MEILQQIRMSNGWEPVEWLKTHPLLENCKKTKFGTWVASVKGHPHIQINHRGTWWEMEFRGKAPSEHQEELLVNLASCHEKWEDHQEGPLLVQLLHTGVFATSDERNPQYVYSLDGRFTLFRRNILLWGGGIP